MPRPLNLCRCCGEDFSGVTAFDLHWKGRRVSTRIQQCRAPESVGLQRDRHGRWSVPS